MITGQGGLGRATAILFVGAGADVVVTDIEADSLAATAGRIAEANSETRCVALTADIRNISNCRDVVAHAERQLGPPNS